MDFSKLSLLLSLLLLTTNCTSIALKIPGATIEASEVAGSKEVELGSTLDTVRGVEYSDNVSSRPPNLDQAKPLGTTHMPLHHARWGIGDRFELGGQFSFNGEEDLQTTFQLIGKYQFLGKPKSQAKQGDWSAGTYLRWSYMSVGASGIKRKPLAREAFLGRPRLMAIC